MSDVMSYPRTLFPGGTNLGKSDVLAALGVYFLDVEGSVLDVDNRERGCKILLFGAGAASIKNFYLKMVKHGDRAESRGHAMPGRRSSDSVLWKVGPAWDVESIAPQVRVSQKAAHPVSGRHEAVQLAIMEEMQGMQLSVIAAIEGMLSAATDKLVGLFNPTESAGPAFQRVKNRVYVTRTLSAFEHENVLERREAIPGAVSHLVIDARVRQECRDRGAYPLTMPDVDHGDFLYALPPSHDAPDPAPRTDGIAGHRDGEVRVYRPEALFEAQVFGRFPLNIEAGLFSPAAWDAGVERWRNTPRPRGLAARLGVDAAREGKDETAYCEAWGPDVAELLRKWALAEIAHDAEALARMQAGGRAWVGEISIAPKGDGPEVAGYIAARHRAIPWNVDVGGVGASVYDHAHKVLGVHACAVSFGGAPPDKLDGEPYCLNARAALYVRAAMAVNRGLVDPPDDPLLREEILAHRIKHPQGSRAVDVIEDGRTVRKTMPVAQVQEKAEVKDELGRSPDRSDAFVLALWEISQRQSGGHLSIAGIFG